MQTVQATNTLLNLTLSRAAQQGQILRLITAPVTPAAEALTGESLNIAIHGPSAFARVPVGEELEELEDRVVDHLAEILSPDTAPRTLLFGPGSSKTDPLYALRFLAKLAIRTDRTGELTAYDVRSNSSLLSYYEEIPWGEHHVRLALGHEGNYQELRGATAHLILAIHPGLLLDDLFAAIAENLVCGGVGIVQCSVLPDFSSAAEYPFLLEAARNYCGDTLEFLDPPIRSRLFRSFFADRSDDVHVLTVSRK